MRLALAAIALVAAPALGLAGCGHKVGDSCKTNVDCSPLGDRFCDTASPGGYCTIEGCDVRMNSDGKLIDSCEDLASESVCIRFFQPLVNRPCSPATVATDCTADERCLCDCGFDQSTGQCLPADVISDSDGGSEGGVQITCAGATGAPSGHCASEASEQRWCMLKCSDDGDCRSGYECRKSGTLGADVVPRSVVSYDGGYSVAVGKAQKFCVQRAQ